MGQKIISQFQGTALIGQLGNFPKVIKAFALNSAEQENNQISRGFSFLENGIVQAGGTTDYAFAGYLSSIDSYANFDYASGGIAPSLFLPNGTSGQIMSEGFMYALVPTAATQGDELWISVSDGSVVLAPEGTTSIPGYRFGFAKIVELPSDAGYAKIYVKVIPSNETSTDIEDFLVLPPSQGGDFLTLPPAQGGEFLVLPPDQN